MLPEPVHIILKVSKTFEKLSIPYFIGGSFASAIHGVMRATMDVDMVADIHPDQVNELVKLLQDEFFIDEQMILEAIERSSSFNLIHLATMFKVDIFILIQKPYYINQMKRRTFMPVGTGIDDQASFTTPEDIILAKLEWFRAGGEVSERQWRDILGVMAIQRGRLDNQYLERWSSILGVHDLLAKAVLENKNE